MVQAYSARRDGTSLVPDITTSHSVPSRVSMAIVACQLFSEQNACLVVKVVRIDC